MNGNTNLILPWAPVQHETEIKKAFERTTRVRKLSKEAAELADYWFCETVVRLHREGVAPYTGLKPAGLDWGPVVPMAEKATEQGNAKDVIVFLTHAVEEELQERFKHALTMKSYPVDNVGAAREFVHAYLGFILYSHHLYTSIKGGGEHGEAEEGARKHEHEFRLSDLQQIPTKLVGPGVSCKPPPALFAPVLVCMPANMFVPTEQAPEIVDSAPVSVHLLPPSCHLMIEHAGPVQSLMSAKRSLTKRSKRHHTFYGSLEGEKSWSTGEYRQQSW
jgi:hypothetical protein